MVPMLGITPCWSIRSLWSASNPPPDCHNDECPVILLVLNPVPASTMAAADAAPPPAAASRQTEPVIRRRQRRLRAPIPAEALTGGQIAGLDRAAVVHDHAPPDIATLGGLAPLDPPAGCAVLAARDKPVAGHAPLPHRLLNRREAAQPGERQPVQQHHHRLESAPAPLVEQLLPNHAAGA